MSALRIVGTMAQQAALLALIAGMKAARDRSDEASDSDDEIWQPTNRGNKLKRRARWVHEGQLDLPTGPKAYRRTVEHGGFKRDIVYPNPPRLDAEGDELDDDEEDPEDDIMGVSDVNPYEDIRLEVLLGPLASLSDLATHPSLSLPYLSTALPDLIEQLSQMVMVEQQKLLRAKNLLEKLLGEDIWIPCGVVEQEQDDGVFNPELIVNLSKRQDTSSLNENGHPATNGKEATDDTSSRAATPKNLTNGVSTEIAELPNGENPSKDADGNENSIAEGTTELNVDGDTTIVDANAGDDDAASQNASTIKDDDAQEAPATRRMTTRAQTQASNSNKDESDGHSHGRSSSTASASQHPHPLFLVPQASRPDRDWSLPFVEAEDTRRLLLMLVQKREESTRGLIRLRDGLLRGNRLRNQVLQWSKAEAHVGEMSDNEDWYDKEEWGLDADLKKGREEDEEDPAAQRKPTRTRRN